MSSWKVVTILALSCLVLSAVAFAGTNKYGVSDIRKITFEIPMRVGDVLLPRGDYTVTHTMDGDRHVMLFKQIGARKPAEARVNCTLVDLPKKATQTEKIFIVNDAKERVLQTLVFEGDLAKHVF